MPIVNKQSVREEFDRLKTEFKKLSAEGKISSEISALFNGLMMLLNLMFAIFLEKTTKKTSRNSGIPPSQTEKDETSKDTAKTNSKGKTEKTTRAANTRTVETIETIPVNECDNCGEDLSKIKCETKERRTRIDIVFEKTVEHVEVEVKRCPTCKKIVKGLFPDYLKGPLQYGNGIKAYVVQLLTT
jgi:hypothetical protein